MCYMNFFSFQFILIVIPYVQIAILLFIYI